MHEERISKDYSISPYGERFDLPSPEDYKIEFDRLKNMVF